MKQLFTLIVILSFCFSATSQNENLSGSVVFDGEPFIAINPNNSQHMVVAWQGYKFLSLIVIKTKVTFNAGQTWSATVDIPHTNPDFQSADPSLEFDNSGNVFLSYIDYRTSIDSGYVYVRKSVDGGLSWGNPAQVISAHSDPGKYPVDRPWIAVDRSATSTNGNVYITTMPPNVFGPLAAPYHPYFISSTNNGTSFNSWQFLDTINWLSGNLIQQPMPSPCVAGDGTFYAVYPSYVGTQNILPQYILVTSTDGGNSFTYNTVFASIVTANDNLSKKGYLLRSDPSDVNHLAFFYLDAPNGDIDVYMRESFNKGANWSSAIRINDDPIANNRMQDLVWADFDADGDLVVSWRDRRNGADSTYSASTEIWGAFRSKDSTNFSPNFPIADALAAHDTILEGAGNDFMCIKLNEDTLNAAWGDTRNGKLTVWFQRMAIDGTLLSVQQLSSEDVPDVILYPNPTSDIVQLKGNHLLNVDIYSQEGKKVMTLSNSSSSNYMEIDISSLANGIYFMQINTQEGIISKKLIKE